jgi:hypothetical protein
LTEQAEGESLNDVDENNSPNASARVFVKAHLRSYLIKSPGCDLKWIKRKIYTSGIAPKDLEDIMVDLVSLGDEKRYKRIFKICYFANFDCTKIK